MSREREIPFDFILDYLLRVETTVKPFFGMTSIYAGQKLLLLLRDRKDEPELNGIWVPTTLQGLESLRAELPSLRQIYALGKRSSAAWLLLAQNAPDFERSAIAVCDLIDRRDPRIGRVSKPRAPRSESPKKSPGAKPPTAKPRRK